MRRDIRAMVQHGFWWLGWLMFHEDTRPWRGFDA